MTAISVSICGLFVVGRSRLKNVCVDAAARVSPNDSFSRLLEGRAWRARKSMFTGCSSDSVSDFQEDARIFTRGQTDK